jgi:hypothetical protein
MLTINYGFDSLIKFPWGVRVVDHCRLVYHIPSRQVFLSFDSLDFPSDERLVELVEDKHRIKAAGGAMMSPEWVDSLTSGS